MSSANESSTDLRLIGIYEAPDPELEKVLAQLVALDLSDLLLHEGDSRTRIDARTGLNKYGCAPFTRDAIPFGSCTSSSPSPRAISAAREALDELRAAVTDGVGLAVARGMMEQVREEIRQQLAVGDIRDLDIVLCPSGTDAEYVALMVRMAGHSRHVRNIVVGPSEVGGGTTLASAGRYFDTVTPRQGEHRGSTGTTHQPTGSGFAMVGSSLDPQLSERTTLETIALRDQDGRQREPDELDAEATALCDAAITAGEVVLLHVVAHSKTGVHAPTPGCLDALKRRYGDDVQIVVDAAQGRVSRRGLREVIERNQMVIFTGSKFYGGPPFAGALLVPHGSTRVPQWSPTGLHNFISAELVPESWGKLREQLDPVPSIGLLLRWKAALGEFRAYYAAPAQTRLAIMRAYERDAAKRLAASPVLELITVPEPPASTTIHRILESKTTVFPFCVRDTSGARLEYPALLEIFHLLNTPIRALVTPQRADELSSAQLEVLDQCFHLGQPVRLGPTGQEEPSVLRLALGGPLITRVAVDPRIGRDLGQRIDWLLTQVDQARAKLELIVSLELYRGSA